MLTTIIIYNSSNSYVLLNPKRGGRVRINNRYFFVVAHAQEEGARAALVDDMVQHVCTRTRFARHPMDGLEWTGSLLIDGINSIVVACVEYEK